MIFMLPVYLNIIEKLMVSMGTGDPFVNPEAVPIALSYFHTAFNLSNVILLIGFVPQLVNLAIRLVPAKSEEDEEFHLEYIGSEIMRTADLSLEEARKEVARLARTTSRMSRILQTMLLGDQESEDSSNYRKITKYEDITDRMEEEITHYLIKVGEGRLSESASIRMRSLLSIVNDLESAADSFYQIAKQNGNKTRKNIVFTDSQNQRLQHMFKLVDEALTIMIENLDKDYAKVDVEEAWEKETEINKFRNKNRKAHLKSVEKKEYSLKSGIAFNEIFLLLERAGNHILNVSRAITGEVGKDDEDEILPQPTMDR